MRRLDCAFVVCKQRKVRVSLVYVHMMLKPKLPGVRLATRLKSLHKRSIPDSAGGCCCFTVSFLAVTFTEVWSFSFFSGTDSFKLVNSKHILISTNSFYAFFPNSLALSRSFEMISDATTPVAIFVRGSGLLCSLFLSNSNGFPDLSVMTDLML